MTQELLQQALDALNESLDCVRLEHVIAVENYGSYSSHAARLEGLKAGVDRHVAAIAAIEAAIAQPAEPSDEHDKITAAAYMMIADDYRRVAGDTFSGADIATWCELEAMAIDPKISQPVQPAAVALKAAAQAVLNRWNSPVWDWAKQGPTADLMHALRVAIEQPDTTKATP